MTNWSERLTSFIKQQKEQNNLRILKREIKQTINKPVSQIMTSKVITIAKNDSVLDAAKTMRNEGVSCLVIESNGKVEGLVTESDFVKKVPLSTQGLALDVSKVMSEGILCGSEDSTIFETHELMVNHQFRKLPIVKNGKLVGIVTQTDVVEALDRFATHSIIDTLNSLHVWELMKVPIVSVKPTATLAEAKKLMADKAISCVLVVENGIFRGIITERDIVSELAKDVGRLGFYHAQDIMKAPIVSIDQNLQLFEANHYMLEKGFRRFFVRTDEEPGIITQTDIARAAYSFLNNLIRRIEKNQLKDLSIEKVS